MFLLRNSCDSCPRVERVSLYRFSIYPPAVLQPPAHPSVIICLPIHPPTHTSPLICLPIYPPIYSQIQTSLTYIPCTHLPTYPPYQPFCESFTVIYRSTHPLAYSLFLRTVFVPGSDLGFEDIRKDLKKSDSRPEFSIQMTYHNNPVMNVSLLVHWYEEVRESLPRQNCGSGL